MNGQLNTQANSVQPFDTAILERLVVNGDCNVLSAGQRVEYYRYRCEALGLDPMTQPFEYIKLNGKLVLYAKAAVTQQLARSRGLSTLIVSQGMVGDSFVVHARAVTVSTQRQTDNLGAVPVSGLKGEALTNAMMKAVTKAQRRAILAHEGLGMLDETETETIPQAVAVPVDEAHREEAQVHEWTEEERTAAYNMLDEVIALCDNGAITQEKQNEVIAKVKGEIATGEEPDKVMNRLHNFINRASKKAKETA